MARLRQLPEDDAEAVRVRAKLHESLPEAVDVVVYAVEHEPARRRYELALELARELKGEVRRSLPDEAQVLGVKELWHSTGEADPSRRARLRALPRPHLRPAAPTGPPPRALLPLTRTPTLPLTRTPTLPLTLTPTLPLTLTPTLTLTLTMTLTVTLTLTLTPAMVGCASPSTPPTATTSGPAGAAMLAPPPEHAEGARLGEDVLLRAEAGRTRLGKG